jgi:hypothetical protein
MEAMTPSGRTTTLMIVEFEQDVHVVIDQIAASTHEPSKDGRECLALTDALRIVDDDVPYSIANRSLTPFVRIKLSTTHAGRSTFGSATRNPALSSVR